MASEKKSSRLGAGLSALFGEEQAAAAENAVQTLPVARLEPRKDQPRRVFDEDTLAALSQSIKEYGLLQPITVRPMEKGYYQIIAGERRWRAARKAGLEDVPVNIVEADDRLATELSLVENLQREDLNPIEEAMGYQQLMDDYGLTQEVIAERVQKSRPAVANALRLLGLDEEMQRLVSSGQLSAGHARALLSIQEPSLRKFASEEILRRHLNVRQAETLAASLQKKKPSSAPPSAVNYVREVERELSAALGREVHFSGSEKKGSIRLDFYSPDDREALIDALRKMKKTTSESRR